MRWRSGNINDECGLHFVILLHKNELLSHGRKLHIYTKYICLECTWLSDGARVPFLAFCHQKTRHRAIQCVHSNSNSNVRWISFKAQGRVHSWKCMFDNELPLLVDHGQSDDSMMTKVAKFDMYKVVCKFVEHPDIRNRHPEFSGITFEQSRLNHTFSWLNLDS